MRTTGSRFKLVVFINVGKHLCSHVEQSTTYCDPRTDLVFELPEPREVAIVRHSQLGFGFVAGSERPVIVRFVTEGDNRLLNC